MFNKIYKFLFGILMIALFSSNITEAYPIAKIVDTDNKKNRSRIKLGDLLNFLKEIFKLD
jgi:hypothetical protein